MGGLPDENAFASEEEANALLGLMMRHWNAIAAEFEKDGVYLPLLDDPDERGIPGRKWAGGFMRGVVMRRRSWAEMFTDPNEGQLMTIPMVAGEIDPDFPKESSAAGGDGQAERVDGCGSRTRVQALCPAAPRPRARCARGADRAAVGRKDRAQRTVSVRNRERESQAVLRAE